MENKKYYVPSADEFHVGFEYETDLAWEINKDDISTISGKFGLKPTSTGNWKKKIFSTHSIVNPKSPGSGFNIYNYNKVSLHFRVKYLDQADIESLGFRYDNNAEPIPSRDDWNIPKTADYELPLAFIKDMQLINGKGWYLYLYKDGTVWIEYIKDNCGMGYIFKGIIKNKSELKRILKQIGINESIQENNKK